jgi:hypothetical protein
VPNQALAGSQVAAPPQIPPKLRLDPATVQGVTGSLTLIVCGGAGDLRVGQTVQPGHSVTLSKNKRLPAVLMAAVGAARSAWAPVRLPVSAEQVDLPFSTPASLVVDDTATRHELAVERRELRKTLADTVRWLAAQGLVTARQAGSLAG